MERTLNKIKSAQSIDKLTSHFLRLLRSGSETRVFLGREAEAPHISSDYGSREKASSLMLDIEYKKAIAIVEFQKRQRYL